MKILNKSCLFSGKIIQEPFSYSVKGVSICGTTSTYRVMIESDYVVLSGVKINPIMISFPIIPIDKLNKEICEVCLELYDCLQIYENF